MPNDIERGAASDPVEPPRSPSVTSDTAGLDRIDPALFRKVMGSFPTGVTVITTQAGGAPRGMTANAFMSGSLEPPLCVVCVAKRAHMHGYLLQTGRFGVNVLAHDQEVYAGHFAGRPVAGLAPAFKTMHCVPLLVGSVASMATEVAARHDCGDHTIFVGHILFMECAERVPLVYHRGGFGALMQIVDREEVPVPEFW